MSSNKRWHQKQWKQKAQWTSTSYGRCVCQIHHRDSWIRPTLRVPFQGDDALAPEELRFRARPAFAHLRRFLLSASSARVFALSPSRRPFTMSPGVSARNRRHQIRRMLNHRVVHTELDGNGIKIAALYMPFGGCNTVPSEWWYSYNTIFIFELSSDGAVNFLLNDYVLSYLYTYD